MMRWFLVFLIASVGLADTLPPQIKNMGFLQGLPQGLQGFQKGVPQAGGVPQQQSTDANIAMLPENSDTVTTTKGWVQQYEDDLVQGKQTNALESLGQPGAEGVGTNIISTNVVSSHFVNSVLEHPRFWLPMSLGIMFLSLCCFFGGIYATLKKWPNILDESHRPEPIEMPLMQAAFTRFASAFTRSQQPQDDIEMPLMQAAFTRSQQPQEDIEMQVALNASLEQQDVSQWAPQQQKLTEGGPTEATGKSTVEAGEEASDEYQQMLTPRSTLSS